MPIKIYIYIYSSCNFFSCSVGYQGVPGCPWMSQVPPHHRFASALTKGLHKGLGMFHPGVKHHRENPKNRL